VVEDASTEPTSLTHDVGESGLWPALANLTEADRDLLIMRAWDELPVTEIAAILNSRPATISARLHKARRRLAKEIDRQGRQDGVLAGQVSSDPSRERRSDSDE
jgi:DNA-directed RNA polymerase specialized sigma24 family protein